MTAQGPPALGAWARSGGFVGIVAAVHDDEVSLFSPGERTVTRVASDAVELLPAGAVTVTISVDVPLPHGVEEETLRRWVAALTDPVLRERGREALAGEGLDAGALLPTVRVDVRAVASGAVCLCGARVPAPPGATLPCPSCGRRAVGPPVAPGRNGG